MSAATSGIEFDALMLPWIALRLSGLRLSKTRTLETRRGNGRPHPEVAAKRPSKDPSCDGRGLHPSRLPRQVGVAPQDEENDSRHENARPHPEVAAKRPSKDACCD